MDIQHLYCLYTNYLDTDPNGISSYSTLVTYLLYVLCYFNYYHCLIATGKKFIQKVRYFLKERKRFVTHVKYNAGITGNKT